jgi:hypothetical protein
MCLKCAKDDVRDKHNNKPQKQFTKKDRTTCVGQKEKLQMQTLTMNCFVLFHYVMYYNKACRRLLGKDTTNWCSVTEVDSCVNEL